MLFLCLPLGRGPSKVHSHLCRFNSTPTQTRTWRSCLSYTPLPEQLFPSQILHGLRNISISSLFAQLPQLAFRVDRFPSSDSNIKSPTANVRLFRPNDSMRKCSPPFPTSSTRSQRAKTSFLLAKLQLAQRAHNHLHPSYCPQRRLKIPSPLWFTTDSIPSPFEQSITCNTTQHDLLDKGFLFQVLTHTSPRSTFVSMNRKQVQSDSHICDVQVQNGEDTLRNEHPRGRQRRLDTETNIQEADDDESSQNEQPSDRHRRLNAVPSIQEAGRQNYHGR